MPIQRVKTPERQLADVLVGLDRCPHCGVAQPEMKQTWKHPNCVIPRGGSGYGFNWAVYQCTSCKLLVLAQSKLGNQQTTELLKTYPESRLVDDAVPERARIYLLQAIGSSHAPDGAAMLAGSAVDAMLKVKGLTEGNVYDRINQAVEQRILTQEMGDWAHEVRLGSNRPRHADEADPYVTPEQAEQSIEFAETLGTVLFVLPSRIANRGVPAQKDQQPT